MQEISYFQYSQVQLVVVYIDTNCTIMTRMKVLPNSSPLVAAEVSEIAGCISEDGCDTGKI